MISIKISSIVKYGRTYFVMVFITKIFVQYIFSSEVSQFTLKPLYWCRRPTKQEMIRLFCASKKPSYKFNVAISFRVDLQRLGIYLI